MGWKLTDGDNMVAHWQGEAGRLVWHQSVPLAMREYLSVAAASAAHACALAAAATHRAEAGTLLAAGVAPEEVSG